MAVLAVDLGGTKVEAALVEGEGVVRRGSRSRAATGPRSTTTSLAAAVAQVVRGAIAAAAPDEHLTGVGIGSAGPIDRVAGTVSPLNLPVEGFPLVDVVSSAIPRDVPTTLALDGLCIALAEARFGAARDAAASVSLVVSTGIGGGIVLDGAPVPGPFGNAGHLGQLRVSAQTSDDPRIGTLEDTASGPASVAWARAHGWAGSTGEDLARDAAAGDAIARSAIMRSAAAVGQAIAGVSALLDVRLFVIGGGFSHAAADYTALVESAAHAAAILPASREIVVTRAALGGDAPLVGAGCLVL